MSIQLLEACVNHQTVAIVVGRDDQIKTRIKEAGISVCIHNDVLDDLLADMPAHEVIVKHQLISSWGSTGNIPYAYTLPLKKSRRKMKSEEQIDPETGRIIYRVWDDKSLPKRKFNPFHHFNGWGIKQIDLARDPKWRIPDDTATVWIAEVIVDDPAVIGGKKLAGWTAASMEKLARRRANKIDPSNPRRSINLRPWTITPLPPKEPPQRILTEADFVGSMSDEFPS